MPFSSLFNRKGSRKNQSKDKSGQISKQNSTTEDGSIKGELTSKTELYRASQDEQKSEDKICEVIEGTAQPEGSVLQDIQDKLCGGQTLPGDNCNEATTEVENDLNRPREDVIQMEEKSANKPSLESENLYAGVGGVESVDAQDSYPDTNGQEQMNSSTAHIASVSRSQNDSKNEENQMKARSCVAEQCECASEKLGDHGEQRDPENRDITTHEDATEEITENSSQKILRPEYSDAVRDNRVEIPSLKNEGMNMDSYDQESTPKTSHTDSSLTAEFSNEEAATFAETNISKEPQTSELVENVLASSESTKEFSSVVTEVYESENEGDVTNCSDYTNSVLPTETAHENEQQKDDLSNNTEDETDEKMKSDVHSPEDTLSENKSINEIMMCDSQKMSHQKECVGTESEKVQSDVHCMEHEGEFEETASSDGKVMPSSHNKESELEKFSQQVESSEDPELRTQVSSVVGEASEEKDHSTDKSLNYRNSEQETEKAQDSEVISLPPLNVANISPAISHVDSTDEKSKTQTTVVVSHQNRRNSTDKEEAETKQVNDGDINSIAEISENNSSLILDEINDTNRSSEVSAAQPPSPLEDSLDSFPSGCEDFLGGQRTLMAAEQHPPPSWKVGYLQVKLPVKSRGRGKLKVWRQRWVVFQMDEFVKDTKNPSLMINIYASESGNARSHSALFWCAVSASKTVVYRSQSKTHKYAFSITVDNDVVLHLAADSETHSQEWMTAIRNLLWPPNPVLQLEKVLHGSDFEVSIIDNEFSFHAGLLGAYGNMKVTSNKLIFSHPQTDHVIQEWYLNTLDKFQLLPQNKEEDAFKVVVMHTGQDSSTGSGQIILFCPEAVTMLQSIASTIHKLLQYKTTSGKDHNQQELASLADWLPQAVPLSSAGDPPEDYYKIPRHQIRSLLDIPNFSFEKPLSNEGFSQSPEIVSSKPSMLTSATSASTFSEDSGISMAIPPDDFLNCSVTSFTIGGHPVRDHTSSESSDGYSPPCSPEMPRKAEETEAT